MKRDQRHGSAYIFDAVCPEKDTSAAIVVSHVNTDAMNLHLEEISLHVAKDAHAVVIIDGAGWHQEAGLLVVPANISLLHLPPYSPELNAQENIWQDMRQNWLASRIFDSLDDIIDACCKAWNNLISETGRIKSIAARNWLSGKAS